MNISRRSNVSSIIDSSKRACTVFVQYSVVRFSSGSKYGVPAFKKFAYALTIYNHSTKSTNCGKNVKHISSYENIASLGIFSTRKSRPDFAK